MPRRNYTSYNERVQSSNRLEEIGIYTGHSYFVFCQS